PPRSTLFPYTTLFRSLGLHALEGIHHARMQGPAPPLQQRGVRDVVREGVLERVLERREQARLVDELRGLEPHEPAPQRFIRQLRSEEHTSELQSRFDL